MNAIRSFHARRDLGPLIFLIVLSVISPARAAEREDDRPRETPEEAADRPAKEDGAPKAGPRDPGGPKHEGVPAAARNSKEGKVFGAYDKDGDGQVTDEEIVAMMEGKQNSRGKREIRKAVKRADKDDDGMLGFEEFAWWYRVGRLDERARNE